MEVLKNGKIAIMAKELIKNQCLEGRLNYYRGCFKIGEEAKKLSQYLLKIGKNA